MGNQFTRTHQLEPKHDSAQSFYHKASVVEDKHGKELISYSTHVASIKDGKAEVYGIHSATTLRHIKEFLKQHGFEAENKQQIINDYIK